MNEQPSLTYFEAEVLKALCCLLQAAQEQKPFAHSRVFADRQLLQRAGVYHGALLRAVDDGTASVEVYDGLDTSGELIDSFYAYENIRDLHIYEKGIVLRVGLYVDLGSNVEVFTAYYDPVPREKG